jgi:hypothetical protein
LHRLITIQAVLFYHSLLAYSYFWGQGHRMLLDAEGCLMEQPILMLDENTDPVVKQMLHNVVSRKKKFDEYKRRHVVALYLTLFFSACYLIYLYVTIVTPYSYSFASMFSAFVNNSLNLYSLILTIGTFGLMNLFREKKDKAEKEFHDLRCEIIDKSKDLWKKEEAWNNRHLVFEMMKKTYDINLYHEKK